MNGILKGFIVGLVVILIGACICIAAVAMNGWDWKISINFETCEYTAESDVRVLELDINYGSLNTVFYDGEKIKITYPQAKNYESELSESNVILKYENKQVKWYNFIMRITDIPAITVYVPENCVTDIDLKLNAGSCKISSGNYGKLDIEVNAGTVNIDGAACETADISVNAGTLYFNNSECKRTEIEVNAGTLNVKNIICPDISADVSAGTINLDIEGIKSEYTISVNVSAGSCNVSNQSGSTANRLKIDCSAGSCNVSFSE